MKARILFVSVALFAATCVPALCAAQGPYSHARQGWLVGFGIGGGTAGISVDGNTSDREGGGAGSFRAGYAFRPEYSLELNSNGWTKDDNGTTLSFSVATAAINYYPGNTGLVLRGGVGFGSADATVQIAPNTTVTGSESGFGFTVGAGYEFRVMRTFAIGPQVDFGWMTLDSFDANYVNFGLSFNWYFVPKG
ncbi:MAG TPA: outer membrane beta-barrel protein [Candidatus Eisenbacteria bacterium]|jgi:hypothetical protein